MRATVALVAATAGLLALGGHAEAAVKRLTRGRGPRWLHETLGVSLAAQLSTLPLILLHFGRLSLISPLANLLVAPVVPLAMLGAASGVLIGPVVAAPVANLVLAPLLVGSWLPLAAMTRGAAVLADVPFLCHLRRAVDLADSDPYAEIARYLAVHRDHVEEVFRTLSYVDAVHLGARAEAPALFSVALMDPICPPSTVYAAFHAYGGPAEIEVYAYNGHEGGQAHHQSRQLVWLREVLAAPSRADR